MLLRRQFVQTLVFAAVAPACRLTGGAGSSDSEPIGPLLAPDALASRLDDVRSGKIAVFYVGPDALFGRGHVPGARNIGPIDTDKGRRALTEALADVPADREIVLYCGCCPVKNCPNVRPASAIVRGLARPNAHVLDLPTDFKTDWTAKGHPIERSRT